MSSESSRCTISATDSFQGRCLLLPKYFCAVYDYVGKADLSKSWWNPKRKLGVTMHFSEIIKLQFGKKPPYTALYFTAF